MNLRNAVKRLEKDLQKIQGKTEHQPDLKIQIQQEFEKWPTEDLKQIAYLSENEPFPAHLKKRLKKAGILDEDD